MQWFRLNGKEVVDRKVLPGSHIPVIRCEGNVLDVNGKVKRKGMVKDLMDPARMFNYWRTAQTERYALTPKGSIEHRIAAGGTEFENLVITGDWTLNGLNIGCVEAAATSGLDAAKAILEHLRAR